MVHHQGFYIYRTDIIFLPFVFKWCIKLPYFSPSLLSFTLLRNMANVEKSIRKSERLVQKRLEKEATITVIGQYDLSNLEVEEDDSLPSSSTPSVENNHQIPTSTKLWLESNNEDPCLTESDDVVEDESDLPQLQQTEITPSAASLSPQCNMKEDLPGTASSSASESSSNKIINFDDILGEIALGGQDVNLRLLFGKQRVPMWSVTVHYSYLLGLPLCVDLEWDPGSRTLSLWADSVALIQKTGLHIQPEVKAPINLTNYSSIAQDPALDARSSIEEARTLKSKYESVNFLINLPLPDKDDVTIYKMLANTQRMKLDHEMRRVLDVSGDIISEEVPFDELITASLTNIKGAKECTIEGFKGCTSSLHPVILPLFLFNLNHLIGFSHNDKNNFISSIDLILQRRAMRQFLNPSKGLLQLLEFIGCVGSSVGRIATLVSAVIEEINLFLDNKPSCITSSDLVICNISPSSNIPFTPGSKLFNIAKELQLHGADKAFIFPRGEALSNICRKKGPPEFPSPTRAYPECPFDYTTFVKANFLPNALLKAVNSHTRLTHTSTVNANPLYSSSVQNHGKKLEVVKAENDSTLSIDTSVSTQSNPPNDQTPANKKRGSQKGGTLPFQGNASSNKPPRPEGHTNKESK